MKIIDDINTLVKYLNLIDFELTSETSIIDYGHINHYSERLSELDFDKIKEVIDEVFKSEFRDIKLEELLNERD